MYVIKVGAEKSSDAKNCEGQKKCDTKKSAKALKKSQGKGGKKINKDAQKKANNNSQKKKKKIVCWLILCSNLIFCSKYSQKLRSKLYPLQREPLF